MAPKRDGTPSSSASSAFPRRTPSTATGGQGPPLFGGSGTSSVFESDGEELVSQAHQALRGLQL
eukprot:1676394-Prorocentrum_lima.AAC.1